MRSTAPWATRMSRRHRAEELQDGQRGPGPPRGELQQRQDPLQLQGLASARVLKTGRS